MKRDSLEECPFCASTLGRTIDSRPSVQGRKRRRKCDSCQQEWMTIEVPMATWKAVSDVSEARDTIKIALSALTKIHEFLDKKAGA